MSRRKRKRKQGSRVVPLLALVSLLCGAGAWNYQRNAAAEQAEPRPYRAYSDVDLEALSAAYRAEVEMWKAHRGSSPRVQARDRGFGAGQVAEFERVHRASRAARDAGYELTEREVELDKIEQERRLRSEMGSELRVFLRRILAFS